MEKSLKEQLQIHHLELDNQSHQHSGHYEGDGETHWSLLVVASDFHGLTRIARHQKINIILKDEFENGLHALTLRTYSPEEWLSHQMKCQSN